MEGSSGRPRLPVFIKERVSMRAQILQGNTGEYDEEIKKLRDTLLKMIFNPGTTIWMSLYLLLL